MRMVASPFRRFLLSRLSRVSRLPPTGRVAANHRELSGSFARFDANTRARAFYSTTAAHPISTDRFGITEPIDEDDSTLRHEVSSTALPEWPGDGHPLRYGKWNSLRVDEQRLVFESDVLVLDPRHPRLVDLKENRNDFNLWMCILDYRWQRDGLRGIGDVMEGLVARGCLFKAKSGAAKRFWGKILKYATLDKDILDNVWAYAQWLYDNHGARWPGLYSGILAPLVREGREGDVLRWNLRLSPNFGVDSDEFGDLLKQFVTERRHNTQRILQTLYRTSLHRDLYDRLIPYLYDSGSSQLARSWRAVLISHNDLPRAASSRPFLRFLAAYLPHEKLEPREIEVAGLELNPGLEPQKTAVPPELRSRSAPIQIPELMDEMPPRTRRKSYNDELGAKYLASTWLSLDFAINSLHLLGVTTVGPLTLQSLSLREENAQGIHKRIEQMEILGIRIGDSSYSQAIRCWAAAENDGMLSDLIHSDIHPDVFDDLELERAALVSAVLEGTWDRYELILNLRLSVAADLARAVSNRLVAVALEIGDKPRTLRFLDMMIDREIQLLESTVDIISSHIPQSFSPNSVEVPEDIGFYACLCSLMLHLRFPPSSGALQTVLLQLSRTGRFDELYHLAKDITSYYAIFLGGGYPKMRVHKSDVPGIARETGAGRFQLLPRDLDWRDPFHPFRLIFTPYLLRHIVLRAFGYKTYVDQAQPKSLHFTDGIRLLSMLRRIGPPFIPINQVELRRFVTSTLAEAPWDLRPLCPPRVCNHIRRLERRRFRVRVAKILVDRAWGEELLPRPGRLVRELRHHINERRAAAIQLKKRLRRKDRASEQGAVPDNDEFTGKTVTHD
ncbi:hypothetical protein QBC47DRAFT_368643 [Echria macrotheca]|uniref:Pentatricopeptide repeat domain-containing protein n=1 Tax=Echria macrotheca TaxID=438768 RepID=A0AAJ0FGF2_9PEZI|nr:hypothetical protein QBC47DRAFT_368643 [Echria macrotheca]